METDRGREKTICILAGVFGLLLLSGFMMRHTLSAFLTSLAVCYLLNPIVKFLEKRCGNRLAAIILLYFFGTIALTIVSLFVIPQMRQQYELLVHEMPVYMQNVKASLERWRIALAPYYSGPEGEWLMVQAEDILNTISEKIPGIGFERLKGALYGIFNLVLAPILVFFMLLYKEFFGNTLLRLVPDAERDYMVDLGRRINRSLEKFILAMIADCLLVGLLCAAALWLLGIQFPLLNGLLAGIASVVPVLGGVVAVIPPSFLGYAASGDLTIIPKICAAYFLIFIIIEGNLIKPLLMKTTLKLNPLAVIFVVMAMGELLGFWGIILAIPLAAVVKLCAGEIHRLYFDRGPA